MNNYSLNDIKIIVGFPKVTEIRIGTALRIAIMYYKILNQTYGELIEIEKLKYLLDNVKNAYKFETVSNYINFVINFYIESENEIFGNGFKNPIIDSINKNIGYNKIQIKAFKYFNDEVLPKLINIVLEDINQNSVEIHFLKINEEDYKAIYEDFSDDLEKCQREFFKDLINWLEYNLIVSVRSAIFLKTGQMCIPVKFSFLEKIGGDEFGKL